MRTFFPLTTILASAIAILSCNVASAQFRLDQFTDDDPKEAVLQMSDGSLVWVMTVEDSTFIWKSDTEGVGQWARTIIDPGAQVHLVESGNSNVIMVEAYPPTTEEITPLDENLITQPWRTTVISAQGAVVSCERGVVTDTLPYETPALNVELRTASTADGGLVFSLLTSGVFMTIAHLVRVDASGALVWCKALGREEILEYLVVGSNLSYGEGLQVVEMPGGNIAMTMETTTVPFGQIGLYIVDPQGEALDARTLDYTGEAIYRHTSCLAVSANGNLLIGGRMSTNMSANIFTYEVDADLEFVDGDIYWDLDLIASAQLSGIAVRNDNDRVIMVSSANSSIPYTYLIHSDGSGNIQHTVRSSQLPYTSDQLLDVGPHAVRFTDTGIELAHSSHVTHPGLGNIGYYVERTLLDPADPGCYFAPGDIQHVPIPANSVNTLPLDNMISIGMTPIMTDESPFVQHSPVGTVQGCLIQTGIAELPHGTSFQITPNMIPVGSDLIVRTDGAIIFRVVDMNGRVVREGSRIPAAGQWHIAVAGLMSGVYSIVANDPSHTASTVQRFLIH